MVGMLIWSNCLGSTRRFKARGSIQKVRSSCFMTLRTSSRLSPLDFEWKGLLHAPYSLKLAAMRFQFSRSLDNYLRGRAFNID